MNRVMGEPKDQQVSSQSPNYVVRVTVDLYKNIPKNDPKEKLLNESD